MGEYNGGSGGNVDGKDISPASVDTDRATIAGEKQYSETEKTVTVPDDYATVQEAWDTEVAEKQNHSLTIDVASGTDEDLFFRGVESRRINDGNGNEGINVRITGDVSAPLGNYSLFLDSISGFFDIEGLDLTRDAPRADYSTHLKAENCWGQVLVDNVTTGTATHAAIVGNSAIKLYRWDLGTDDHTIGFLLKGCPHVHLLSCSGSVTDDYYQADSSLAFVEKNSGTGATYTFNSRFPGGLIYNYDDSDTSSYELITDATLTDSY